MADNLTKAYDIWYANQKKPTEFQCFQAGFTIAAVSMRKRAMAACDNRGGQTVINNIKNAIGQLSDIPE